MADAVQPQRNRNLARHHADDGNGNRVRRHLLSAVKEEVRVLPLTDVDAAAPAANNDAGARLADLEPRIGPRFASGDDPDERGARISFGIGAVVDVPEAVALEHWHVVNRDIGDRRGNLTA